MSLRLFRRRERSTRVEARRARLVCHAIRLGAREQQAPASTSPCVDLPGGSKITPVRRGSRSCGLSFTPSTLVASSPASPSRLLPSPPRVRHLYNDRMNTDPLDLFLPPVREWFRAALGAPTLPQRQGWPAIAAGQHTLILAPTGS